MKTLCILLIIPLSVLAEDFEFKREEKLTHLENYIRWEEIQRAKERIIKRALSFNDGASFLRFDYAPLDQLELMSVWYAGTASRFTTDAVPTEDILRGHTEFLEKFYAAGKKKFRVLNPREKDWRPFLTTMYTEELQRVDPTDRHALGNIFAGFGF